MKINSTNNEVSTSVQLKSNVAVLPSSQDNLQSENSSLLSSNEDILTLSEDAIKAFFENQASTQGKTIVETKTNYTRFIPSNENTTSTFEVNSPEVLNVQGFKNKLYDSESDDLLYVKGTSNQLNSEQGNDELFVVGDKNKITGGDNNIKATVLGDSNQITISGSGALTAVLSGINTITTDKGNDSIILDGKRNTISTGDGADTIVTYGNEHLINSGSGNDKIEVDGKSFNIFAGTGDDTITTNGKGQINGDEGNDTIDVTGENNTVNGGNGDDTIKFTRAKNTINGNDGNDTFQVNLSEGNVTVDGGKDTDTVQLNFKRSDYAIIVGNADLTFYHLSDHSEKLKITATDVEQFQFSDGENLSLDEIRNLKGLDYQLEESNDKSTTIKNTDSATNVFDLNVPTSNILKSTKISSGVKISYRDTQNQKKTVHIQNFSYLKLGEDNFVDLNAAPNFEKLNTDISEDLVISKETSKGIFKTKFYDKTSEDLLLSKEYVVKGNNFLLSNGSLISAADLSTYFSGKSVDVTTDTTSVNSITPTTNTANLKFSSSEIYKIDKTDLNSYQLTYKKNKAETGTISLKNISFLKTEEGDELSLESIYKNANTIRKNEKAYTQYLDDAKNTEFKRIAFNLTGNNSYLTSLIGGGYENLSAEKKTTVVANASKLESSLSFTSDYTDNSVDDATKKLYTLRTANLLSNRSDVLQNLTDTGLRVNFTKEKSLGGDSSAFVTGTATHINSNGTEKYEINLTLSAFYGGLFNGNDGDNVDIHETAHILDFKSDEADSLPIGIQDSAAATYKNERDSLFKAFSQTQDDVGVIKSYAFTNNKEFLAVSVENYYERPTELETTSPQLYSSLAEYFSG